MTESRRAEIVDPVELTAMLCTKGRSVHGGVTLSR
jgi:hypothetical protein